MNNRREGDRGRMKKKELKCRTFLEVEKVEF